MCSTSPRSSTPYGIRTRATALKGRRPRPLDEGGQNRISPGYSQRSYRWSPVSLGHRGPNPQTSSVPETGILNIHAPIAQLVELRTFNPQVLGSSPSGGTDPPAIITLSDVGAFDDSAVQQLVCQWSTGVVPDLLARRAAKRRVTAISLVMLS